MFSLFRWQKINFKTSQFNHFAFCRKSMTHDGYVVKVFFATCSTNPIWVWVQIRGYLHFFCIIANKNSTTTFVRPGGLCYKTREICHGDILTLIKVHPVQVSVVAEFSLLVSIYKQFPDLAIKNTADRSSHADTKGIKVTYLNSPAHFQPYLQIYLSTYLRQPGVWTAGAV